MTCEFTAKVKPEYIKLINLRIQFREVELSAFSRDDIMLMVDSIEQAEMNVLKTWAEATRDINPSMMCDLESGSMKWCPALDDYLTRMLLDDKS